MANLNKFYLPYGFTMVHFVYRNNLRIFVIYANSHHYFKILITTLHFFTLYPTLLLLNVSVWLEGKTEIAFKTFISQTLSKDLLALHLSSAHIIRRIKMPRLLNKNFIDF